MSFFKSQTPAPAPAKVPEDCWALLVADGPVALGFTGLCIAASGEVEQVVFAGQKLSRTAAKRASQLWWVRQGRWAFEFAPEPELAPEAGLAVEIEPFDEAGDYGLLSPLLVSQKGPITAGFWGALMRSVPCIRTLPPCVTVEQLDRRRKDLHIQAIKAWGVRVLSLRRVGLSPPEDKHPTSGSDAVHTDASVALAGSTVLDSAQLPWAEVVTADRRACRRLAKELPALDGRLRSIWTGDAWSSDMAVYQVQRRLQQRLSLLGDKFGIPVSIDQRLGNGGEPNADQRRLLAAAALRAEQALGNAWVVLESMVPGAAPSSENLDALEQVVDRLEREVNRRLTTWWELAA